MKKNMVDILYDDFPWRLIPGEVDKRHFLLLISITSIRSRKVINALEDYFVGGKNRKEVCYKHKINQGYLSIKVRELQEISAKIYNASHFI